MALPEAAFLRKTERDKDEASLCLYDAYYLYEGIQET